MNEKIRWGIIGLGKIAHKFASDLQLCEGSELHGIASRNKDKAEEFAKSHPAKKTYGSYEELAIDPDIDIVYIATPHVFHFEHTLLCLKHGKHVLCEKPLGMDAKQVQTLIAKAQENKLFLMGGLWTRFIPATGKLLEILNQKVIGEITFITADFGFKAPAEPNKRLYNKSLGGGSLLDIGIYPIYLSLLLLGQPENVLVTARFSDTGIDTFCSMLFEYTSSQRTVLTSTFEANTPTQAVIYGTNGSIRLHTPFHHSEKITLNINGREEQEFKLPILGEGYVHEIQEVEKCLHRRDLESAKHNLAFSRILSETLDRVRDKIGLRYRDQ